MSLVVNTNMASLSAIGALGKTQRSLGESMARLSEGLRITKAADDAAGLGVATNLHAESVSGRQAMRNTNDGISIIQTAEGASDEVVDLLTRMRELAVESSSDTLASTERAYIQDEVTELVAEVARIASATEFNGIQLSDGSTTSLSVQVGVQNADSSRISITLSDLTTTTLSIGSLDMTTAAGARTAIDTLDTALDTVNDYRSGLGATQNRLDSAYATMETYVENLSAAESQIRDADFAFETAEMTKLQILQQSGIAVLAQAKGMNQGAISLLS
jgi:flagellin